MKTSVNSVFNSRVELDISELLELFGFVITIY